MWNPWHGCKRCSAGCANCFVYYLDGLRDRDASVITRSKTNFDLPLKRDRHGNYKLPSGSVATCFTSDFFIENADEWRAEAWEIIKQRPDVDFLICTKRVHRFAECLPPDWNDGYNNISLAVSCENQQKADERLPYLLTAKAVRKYVFAAPILENIDLDEYLATGKIDMVSVGGESYANARVCDFDWIKNIYSSCKKYGVKFDFHQTGANFVMNGKHYAIKHRDEYSQAKKGMEILKKI